MYRKELRRGLPSQLTSEKRVSSGEVATVHASKRDAREESRLESPARTPGPGIQVFPCALQAPLMKK
jgi:hypothetical protein